MKGNIIISVIIPVYNVERYIDRCVNSVLRQTYKNFELILVNDGSTDSSYEHLVKYNSDSRIIIVNKPNSGQSDSRYQGLLKSTGDYIYFMDSDDTIEQNTLEILAEEVLKNGSDIVLGRYRLIDEYGKELRRQSLYNVNALNEKEQIIKDSLCVNNFKASLWIKLIRKALLLECFNDKVRSLRINEDVLLSFLLSTNCNKVTFRNEIIYNVLQRKDSLTRNIKPELITCSDIIYGEIQDVLNGISLFNDLKNEYYGGYAKTLLYALAVAAKHTQSYSSFSSLYNLLDKQSIYYSEGFKDNIMLISFKYRVLYYVSKRPRLFYYVIRAFKNSLQY